MGAVNFSLDVNLADVLKSSLGLEAFVETGTFRGETVDALKDKFESIYTIELSPEYYAEAVSKFEGDDHINVLHGDSSQELKRVAGDLQDTATLYFLDAHWCVAENTASELSQCPLLAELGAVGALNESSVIIIDDARLFLAPPLTPHETSHWPTLDEIIIQLRDLSSSHLIMVLNDNIIFYPKSACAAVSEYGKEYGVDWLDVLHTNRDYENLRQQFAGLGEQLNEKDERMESLQEQLREKESNPQVFSSEVLEHLKVQGSKQIELEESMELLLKECNARLIVIEDQKRALDTFLQGDVFTRIKNVRLVKRIIGLMRPKLGQLNQHPPKAVQLPMSYSRKISLADWPSISIVTPAFAQGNFIERTIKSVLDQDYPNLEYFIQDGGSQDETVDVIKKYEHRLSGWKSEQDSGQSQAINRGMVQTSGEIMAWLNSDDLLLPGSLAYVAEYFSKNPDVDVIYGHRLLIDDNDMEIGKWIMPKHDHEVLSWADYVPQETMFWRRSIWEKAGGKIDEEFRFAMDWDLILRFRDAGARFTRLPRFLGGFRVHPEQKSSAVIHDIGVEEMNLLRKRVLGRVPARSEIHRSLYLYLIKHIFAHLNFVVRKRMGA